MAKVSHNQWIFPSDHPSEHANQPKGIKNVLAE
jgi:hypothetical protein